MKGRQPQLQEYPFPNKTFYFVKVGLDFGMDILDIWISEYFEISSCLLALTDPGESKILGI